MITEYSHNSLSWSLKKRSLITYTPALQGPVLPGPEALCPPLTGRPYVEWPLCLRSSKARKTMITTTKYIWHSHHSPIFTQLYFGAPVFHPHFGATLYPSNVLRLEPLSKEFLTSILLLQLPVSSSWVILSFFLRPPGLDHPLVVAQIRGLFCPDFKQRSVYSGSQPCPPFYQEPLEPRWSGVPRFSPTPSWLLLCFWDPSSRGAQTPWHLTPVTVSAVPTSVSAVKGPHISVSSSGVCSSLCKRQKTKTPLSLALII